jgi:hypothetical protein
MKTLTVQIPDDVYERVERRAAARGASLDQEVAELLEGVPSEPEDTRLAAVRARMRELFRTIKGFRFASAIPREELYERGSVR